MNIYHDGNKITKTDYYQSSDYARGQAWLLIEGKTWHALLPHRPPTLNVVQAYPVAAEEEPGGWLWCLDVDGHHFQIPQSRMRGERPDPPPRDGHLGRRVVLYTGYGGNAARAAFGGCHDLRGGLQTHALQLWLVNEIRVGRKLQP